RPPRTTEPHRTPWHPRPTEPHRTAWHPRPTEPHRLAPGTTEPHRTARPGSRPNPIPDHPAGRRPPSAGCGGSAAIAARAAASTRATPSAIVAWPSDSTASRQSRPPDVTRPTLCTTHRPVASRGIQPFFTAHAEPSATTGTPHA